MTLKKNLAEREREERAAAALIRQAEKIKGLRKETEER
jgi:hypothetical protein